MRLLLSSTRGEYELRRDLWGPWFRARYAWYRWRFRSGDD